MSSDNEQNNSSETKHTNRATQDAIIVSFVAIFCSYYWVTVIWPMIQRRREIYKEKLITIEKLKRKQQTMEVEPSNLEVYETATDSKIKKDANLKKASIKFNLKETIRKSPESKFDITEDVSVPVKKGYVQDESKISSLATDHNLNNDTINEKPSVVNAAEEFVSVVLPGDGITLQLSEEENDEKAQSSVLDVTGNVLPCIDSKSTTELANPVEVLHDGGSAGVESSTKVTNDHRILWSHISRTTNNASYNTYNDTYSNPWASSLNATATNDPGGLAGNHSDSLTYLEAREIRALQDAEYSSSLTSERKERSTLEKQAELEVFYVAIF